MKANELRIGNYLHDGEDRLCQVIKLDVEFGDEDDIYAPSGLGITSLPYKPIPLTEEWLLNLGFEDWGTIEVNEYESYKRYVLHNAVGGTSNYEVHLITSTYGGTGYYETLFSVDDETLRILDTDYVHNLQNSYYLTTGNELTL